MHLLAILVCNDFTLRCTRIGTKHDAIFEEAANDGRTRAGRLRQAHTFPLQEVIPAIPLSLHLCQL